MSPTEANIELWAVHTLGMDDLHPCASRRLAIRNATWLNLELASSYERYDDEHWPFVYNVPVLWEGKPEEHATWLAAEENADARWSDVDCPVIQASAAAISRAHVPDEPT